MANKANETNNVDYIMEQIKSISSDKFHAKKIDNYIQFTDGNRSYYLSFNPKDLEKYTIEENFRMMKFLGVGEGSQRCINYFKEAIPDCTGKYVKYYNFDKKIEISSGKFLVILLNKHLICFPTGIHHFHVCSGSSATSRILDYGEITNLDSATIGNNSVLLNDKVKLESWEPSYTQSCIDMPSDPIEYQEQKY